MAQLTVLMAGLLFLVESQASDVAAHSTLQGFLSKYMPFGPDVSRSSMSDYDKFITPNLNRVKHGDGAKSMPSHNNPAEPGPNTAARREPSISTKDLELLDEVDVAVPSLDAAWLGPEPGVSDTEEKQAVQKVVTNDSNPISFSAVGIGLLSLATMLAVRLQRGLQPATVPASSGGLGPVMPINTASALGDNVMELKSQDPNINDSASVLESRPEHKVNSNRVGWGQLSSQSSCPLTVCYAGDQKGSAPQGNDAAPLKKKDTAPTMPLDSLKNAFEKTVQNVTGNEEYKFGDATRSIGSAAANAINQVTGEEEYKFGDLSRFLDRAAKEKVAELTGKEQYEFGDLTKVIVSRAAELDMQEATTLLNTLQKVNIDLSPVGDLLPIKFLIDVLNYSLLVDVGRPLASMVAVEIDKRFKATATGDGDYKLGDLTKNAMKTFTGKDNYEYGDVSREVVRRFEERSALKTAFGEWDGGRAEDGSFTSIEPKLGEELDRRDDKYFSTDKYLSARNS